MGKLVIDCSAGEIGTVEISEQEAAQIADDQMEAAATAAVESTTATRRAQVLAKVDQRISQAENAYDNWGVLSNAQKDAALKQVVLAVAKLGRLALNRFDLDES